MAPRDIEDIRIAGLVHDVGKISVPTEILSKPGKLTPVEFQLIMNHSDVGLRDTVLLRTWTSQSLRWFTNTTRDVTGQDTLRVLAKKRPSSAPRFLPSQMSSRR